MRITRLWVPDLSGSADAITLNARNHHYLSRVLRAKIGISVELFDGSGSVATGIVESISKHATLIRLSNAHAAAETRIPVVLCLALIKPDRFDWALQKATELGVTGIQPLVTRYTEATPKREQLDKKVAHWHEIIVNACEQSGHNWLPTLYPVTSLSPWIATPPECLVIAHPSLATKPINAPAQGAHLVIGPEGGFTDEEVNSLLEAGASGLSLGPRILRAETAAVVGTTLLARDLGFL